MNPKRLLSSLALAALAAAAGNALAQPVPIALVSELEGAVRSVHGKEAGALKLLADVAADTHLELAAGARVVLLVLTSGEEATVKGPATAQVDTAGIRSTPAAALTRRTSGVGNVKLRRKDLAQAAIVMRKTDETVRLPLLSLAGTFTLDDRPVFRWAPVEGSGPYRFVLRDGSDRVLHEAVTQVTTLALPATVTLAPEHTYTWEIATRRANGIEYSNFGDFEIAGQALRAEALRLRPPAGAAFSERVAYAVWLDTVGLADAAREAWLALSRERPGEESLRRMAAP